MYVAHYVTGCMVSAQDQAFGSLSSTTSATRHKWAISPECTGVQLRQDGLLKPRQLLKAEPKQVKSNDRIWSMPGVCPVQMEQSTKYSRWHFGEGQDSQHVYGTYYALV